MMQQLMAHFFRDGVRVGNREFGRNRDVQFRMQTMTEPARSDITHFFDCFDVLDRVPNFIDHTWLDAVRMAVTL